MHRADNFVVRLSEPDLLASPLVVLIRSGLSTWGLVRAEKTGYHAVRMGMFYGMLAHVPHVRAYSSEFLYGVSRGVFGHG
jgi:ABC-type arginine/histidine transport system permease subunit